MSSGAREKELPPLLLLEPDNLIRGTVVAVCRDLALAHVIPVTSAQLALRVMREDRVSACVLSLSEREPTLDIINRLRGGEFRSPAELPVAVTSGAVDATLAQVLKALCVRRMLLKPFKIRDSIITVESLLKNSSVFSLP